MWSTPAGTGGFGGGGGFGGMQQQQQQQHHHPSGSRGRGRGGGTRGGGGGTRGGSTRGGGRGGGGRGGPPPGSGTGLLLADQYLSFLGRFDLSGPVKAIEMSDDKLFVGLGDGTVTVLDLEGKIINNQKVQGPVTALHYAGSWLFVGYMMMANGLSIGAITAYDLSSATGLSANLEVSAAFAAAHVNQVTNIRLVGDSIVSSGADGTLRLWKYNPALNPAWVLAGTFGENMVAHNAPITALTGAVVNSFALVCSGSATGDIKIWSAENGACLVFIPQAHPCDIVGFCVIAHNVLSCGSYDHSVKVWDLNRGTSLTTPEHVFITPSQKKGSCSTCISLVSFVPDQPTAIAIGFDNGAIRLFNVPAFTDLGYFNGHDRNTKISKLGQWGAKFFVGTETGHLNIFAINSG